MSGRRLATDRRVKRRQSFSIVVRGSQLSQRQRQSERLRKSSSEAGALSIWHMTLGVFAFSEFITYVLPTPDLEDVATERRWIMLFRRRQVLQEPLTSESAVLSLKTTPMYILYWMFFFDAFVQAYAARDKTFRHNEKEKLLHGKQMQQRWRWSPSLVFVLSLAFYLSILPFWFWFDVASVLGAPSLLSPGTVQEAAIDHANYSLAYALLVRFYENLSAGIRGTIAEEGLVLQRTLMRRVARFFIFHPVKGVRRYRKFRVLFIWIRYLSPIGAHIMNSEVLVVVTDMVKRWKQGAHVKYAHIVRRSLWRRLDYESRRELAAIIIQRNHRSYRGRKWARLVRLEVEKREEETIKLVQKAIMTRSLSRLREQEDALEELEDIKQQNARQRDTKWTSQGLFAGFFDPLSNVGGPFREKDARDQKRKYELQEEIKRKIGSEKERLMLIRPDSRFVFRYQLLYVICAILETAHLILYPRLYNVQNSQDVWTISVLRFFFRHTHVFINIILGLGILIKFFVGDIDPVTGHLVPRSFFSRWIYPGLLLHMVVNPSLAEISSLVRSLIIFILQTGPGRVWRWWLLFMLPIWNRFIALLEWKIWIRLVQHENQNLTSSERRLSVSI